MIFFAVLFEIIILAARCRSEQSVDEYAQTETICSISVLYGIVRKRVDVPKSAAHEYWRFDVFSSFVRSMNSQ